MQILEKRVCLNEFKQRQRVVTSLASGSFRSTLVKIDKTSVDKSSTNVSKAPEMKAHIIVTSSSQSIHNA